MVKLVGSAHSADTVPANLLALETSGSLCSVCLRHDGNVFSLTEHVQKRHNERLLPMLDALLDEAGITRDELQTVLETVAFGAGPGSFTGIRIAAAAAQAVALVSGASVAAVSSCEALALAGRDLDGEAAVPGVVTLIRSRRDLFYTAGYELAGGRLVVRMVPRLLAESPGRDFYEQVKRYRVVGDRPSWWRGTEVLEDVRAAASHVLEVATSMVAAGLDVDPAAALPVYLEGDAPWSKSS